MTDAPITPETARPILFSGPMVRAILDGRKTQTRRVLRDQPQPSEPVGGGVCDPVGLAEHPYCWLNGYDGSIQRIMKHPPRILPGDLLWVREQWRLHKEWDHLRPSQIDPDAGTFPPRWNIQYVADQPSLVWDSRLRAGMHMPRWASRIDLRVTDVRVQRLQDISEADAIAEGIAPLFTDDEKRTVVGLDPDKNYGWTNYLWHGLALEPEPETADAAYSSCADPRASFRSLWLSINGPDAWDANPWVAVYSFERVKP